MISIAFQQGVELILKTPENIKPGSANAYTFGILGICIVK